MAQCPKCQRSSLEYSEGRKVGWCLYADCGFSDPVQSYDDYVERFERVAQARREASKQETEYAAQ